MSSGDSKVQAGGCCSEDTRQSLGPADPDSGALHLGPGTSLAVQQMDLQCCSGPLWTWQSCFSRCEPWSTPCAAHPGWLQWPNSAYQCPADCSAYLCACTPAAMAQPWPESFWTCPSTKWACYQRSLSEIGPGSTDTVRAGLIIEEPERDEQVTPTPAEPVRPHTPSWRHPWVWAVLLLALVVCQGILRAVTWAARAFVGSALTIAGARSLCAHHSRPCSLSDLTAHSATLHAFSPNARITLRSLLC